mmetsp:Transcript_19353/g.62173  ORF Transcript_19353/g.62173 Transcript_19353/m.62173 type:complete len:109 (-) Transcript_19353:315-641(-)
MAMATDNEIAALKEEIKDANLKIKQAEEALGGNADGAGNYAEYAKLAFAERKPFLEKRLSELESRLKDLRKKENVLLAFDPASLPFPVLLCVVVLVRGFHAHCRHQRS